MRFLVALAFLATAYGSYVTDECAWGESYWCSNLLVASKCGATQHCMDTVWANTVVEKEETDVCQFCEAIIKDVRDFIDDQHNQDEVKTFLTNACNIIPDEQLANQCKESVTQELEQLIKMIDSELDPATVCSAMGLCSGFKDRVQHTPAAPEKKTALKAGTDVCEFCESVIKDIRAFVDDEKNQQQVEDMLNKICNLIPDTAVAELCQDAVSQELTSLVQMIDSALDPSEVCKAMHLCDQAKKPQPEPIKSNDEPLCQDCTNFFMEIKSKLTDSTTQKEIQELIEEELCSRAGPYEDVCKVAVETYLPEIMQMMAQDMDPATICSAIGFCKSTPEARTILAKLRLQTSPIFGAIQAGSAEECLLCKTVLGELQQLERNPAMQKDVENFVKKNLCGLLGTMQGVCESTVDEFGPELFELLVNELDPATRCSSLGFCSADTVQSVQSVLRASVPKSAPPKVSPVSVSAAPSTQCVLCEYVIQTLDSELADNATEAEIVQALDEVCDILPDTIKEPCEAFVKQYGPTVIALLLQELDPKQVCTKLGLCTGDSVAAAPVSASTECVLCQFVMMELDQLLEANKTETEIIAALDKVCSILPTSVQADCMEFVNTYGPAVIALLQQELQPDVICGMLGLCPAHTQLKAPVADAETCGICETVIQYMDSLIEENTTIEEIEKVLDKICNFLPDTIQQECDDLVKQYGPAIIELLAQYLDPKEICTSIGLCSNASKAAAPAGGQQKESNGVEMEMIEPAIVPAKAHMLGEKECTMGPAFWCLNMENALKCNMVDHCKRNVWN